MCGVHIRHLCLTETMVSPLRRGTFSRRRKSNQKGLPHRTAFAALRFPRSGSAPWARRHRPSMAHRGSPGIHAGRPTPQNLLSASREGGQIKSRRGGRPAGLFECRIFDRHMSLWEPGLPAMQAPRSIWMTEVLPSWASPLPQELVLVLVLVFAFAFAFAFAVATRLSRQHECPSQKAERRCCYGGGVAGRRASRDGPWMARRGVPP